MYIEHCCCMLCYCSLLIFPFHHASRYLCKNARTMKKDLVSMHTTRGIIKQNVSISLLVIGSKASPQHNHHLQEPHVSFTLLPKGHMHIKRRNNKAHTHIHTPLFLSRCSISPCQYGWCEIMWFNSVNVVQQHGYD